MRLKWAITKPSKMNISEYNPIIYIQASCTVNNVLSSFRSMTTMEWNVENAEQLCSYVLNAAAV